MHSSRVTDLGAHLPRIHPVRVDPGGDGRPTWCSMTGKISRWGARAPMRDSRCRFRRVPWACQQVLVPAAHPGHPQSPEWRPGAPLHCIHFSSQEAMGSFGKPRKGERVGRTRADQIEGSSDHGGRVGCSCLPVLRIPAQEGFPIRTDGMGCGIAPGPRKRMNPKGEVLHRPRIHPTTEGVR